MLAVERTARCVEVAAEAAEQSRLLRLSNSARLDDDVLDGWIASLTPDEFEHLLASLAGARGGRAKLHP